MNKFLKLLAIFYIFSSIRVHCELTNNVTATTACDSHCYKVLRPLLEYATEAKTKLDQLTALELKLHDQRIIIDEHAATMLSKDQLINEKNLRIIELQTALELKSKQLLEQAQAKQLEEKLSRYLEQRAAASCVPFENSTDVQTIRVPGIDPFKVSCDSSLIGSGWTVIQRRQDGSESFNREWSDYRAGFGNLRSEFFVGLEKLYLMTKTQPHELYIHLEDFQHNTRYARYTNFAIGSEEEAYKLESIGNYTGNAGDSMAYHLDYKFSTPDRDNDVNPTNCAKHFQSGWWFHKCYNCNLNGVYTMTDSEKDLDVLQWRTWHHKPLRFVQMMIRPKTA